MFDLQNAVTTHLALTVLVFATVKWLTLLTPVKLAIARRVNVIASLIGPVNSATLMLTSAVVIAQLVMGPNTLVVTT